MCYTLLLSTSSDEDLALQNTELVRFSRDVPDEPGVTRLRYRHRWYVGSKTGCSCTFRHLHSVELGFGGPVHWYPEEQTGIDATLELFRLIRRLVEDGHGVDCVDLWSDHEPVDALHGEREVKLASVADAEFRLFENYYFSFTDQ